MIGTSRMRPAAMAAALLAAGAAGCRDGGLKLWKWPGQTAPKGADAEGDFTILLYVESTPERHVEFVKDYKRIVQEQTGWRDLFIVHKSTHSELYRGRYPTPEAAEDDLKEAKAYRTPVGVPLFGQAMIVPLPGKSVGPPEWDILNARGAMYSVLIAVFYDVQEARYVGRRQFAVDLCRQLREKGEPAYYYHGPSRSHVCIGAFDASAVRLVRDASGKVTKIDYAPEMEAIKQRHPLLAENGREVYRVITTQEGEKMKFPVNSYVFRIPRKEAAGAAGPVPGVGDAEPR